MTLFKMSITGAVIIMVIVLIRALAINRLPKKTFLLLWGIALCRLLVPFNFPSPFSAYNLIRQEGNAPQMQIGNAITFVQPIGQPSAGMAATDFVANAINIPLLIWLLGTLALAAYFIITYFLCRREFRTSLPIQNEYVTHWLAQRKMKRTITIRQSSCILAPLTYGIWKPIILMPKNTNWQNTKQIEYVLAHELFHIKRFDTATKFLLTAALCIHWFNPLVWAMYILSNRDMELSCDETVIRSFGDTTKSAYAQTLICMEESKSKLTPLCNNFSKNAIEERITAIMKTKKTSVVALVLAILLIGGVTTVFATSAKAEKDNAEQTELAKGHTAELIKQYLVYKDYGLTYEPKTDSFYYNGKLVRWFADKINADNQYVTFVRGYDGMDLRAVRNSDYKLTGIAEVSQAEYDKHTQSIKAAQSTEGAYEQGDSNAALTEQMNLLSQYGEFGVSFNSNAEMLYNGELVRYFCDGVELEAGAWSTRYQYLNGTGTVDVFTKRTVIDNGDGSKDPFGNLIALKRSSQKEFEQRNLSDFSLLSEETTTAESNSSDAGGMTFAEKFSKYKPYGIEYKEDRQGSGYGNVYLNGELVKAFIDETPGGGVFYYTSKDGGTITVQTVYDSTGNFVIKPLKGRSNLENTQELNGFANKNQMNETNKNQLQNIEQLTAYGYVGAGYMKVSSDGVEKIYEDYKKHGMVRSDEDGSLSFEGKRVREFIREQDGWRYFDDGGVIDLYFDEQNNKLQITTQDEYDKRSIVLSKYEKYCISLDQINETLVEEEPAVEELTRE